MNVFLITAVYPEKHQQSKQAWLVDASVLSLVLAMRFKQALFPASALIVELLAPTL